MDINQPESCFVCNRYVLDKGVLLSTETTSCSKTPFPTKIMQLLGDEFMVVILEDDKICLRCANLINRTDKLEQDLKKTQSIIRRILYEKYNLNEEVNLSSTGEELQRRRINNYINDEENLMHSPTAMVEHLTYDEEYKINKYLESEEELFNTSVRIGNDCDLRIKSEPVNNCDQYLSSNGSQNVSGNCDDKITEAFMKKIAEDDITFKKNHTTLSSSLNELNQIIKEPQDLGVLKLKKEQLSVEYKENNIKIATPLTSNHPSSENGTSEKSVAVSTGDSYLNENTSEIKCGASTSVEDIKDILTSNIALTDKSSEPITGKVSETELPNTAAGKKLSEKSNGKSFSFNLNKQNRHNRIATRKGRRDHTRRKLRPILPKVSSIKEVLSSFYIIQHPDSSIGNEILNECPKYNLSIKSEYSREIETSSRGTECISNQYNLNEEGQLPPITEIPLIGYLNTDCTPSDPICNADLNNPKVVKSHEKEHLRGGYKCSFCSKSFKRKRNLRNHEVVHTRNYTHCCEFCGQGFPNVHHLEDHRRKHTKEDCFICDVCGKTFQFRGTYWIHRKWHDNPYPYKCDECGKLFKHSSRLSVHRRKHSGERPYKCSYCELTFNVSSTLKRHLMLHTKRYPFNCVDCDKGFTTRAKYNNHLARKHNKIVEKTFIDPKDFKMVVYDNPKEKTQIESTRAQKTIDFSENNCNIDVSENSELIFSNNPSDCHIEIILPPSSIISDNSFSNMSWLS